MSHRSEKIIKNLSIDCVIFGFENADLEVLLIKRAISPRRGWWALPGGFILKDEDLNQAARRILFETTGVTDIYMEQVATFGRVDRFPERRVITIAYYALINPEEYALQPGIDTSEATWFPISQIPEMPFDHNEILHTALKQLRRRLRTKPIGFELLPDKFTLTQLQNLYEKILGIALDKRNFRKKLQSMQLLVMLNEKQKGVAHRAAQLYKFDKHMYDSLIKNGFNFEL
jgi:ADP-ribose pyrophosphatase YjhB (NUDIX family)